MTVKELIKNLKQFDENEEVMVSYELGDYWDTTAIKDIVGAEPALTKWSDNLRTFKLTDNIDKEYDEWKEVIVLI